MEHLALGAADGAAHSKSVKWQCGDELGAELAQLRVGAAVHDAVDGLAPWVLEVASQGPQLPLVGPVQAGQQGLGAGLEGRQLVHDDDDVGSQLFLRLHRQFWR